jgi:plastocyanin
MTKLLRSFTAPMLAAALLTSCSGGGDKGVTNPGGGGVTPVLTSITISGSTSTNVGGTLQLTASPKDQTGAAINAAVVWSTSSAFVANVNSSGLVTGIAAGQATITATSGAIASSTLVTVTSGTFPLSATVNMPGTVFSPTSVDIAQGGSVSFVFPALAHNVLFSSSGSPQDIPITSNATISRTFATKGTFNYVCSIHTGMVGAVVVH